MNKWYKVLFVKLQINMSRNILKQEYDAILWFNISTSQVVAQNEGKKLYWFIDNVIASY